MATMSYVESKISEEQREKIFDGCYESISNKLDLSVSEAVEEIVEKAIITRGLMIDKHDFEVMYNFIQSLKTLLKVKSKL